MRWKSSEKTPCRKLVLAQSPNFTWQRAVNRQPGYRSGNSKGRSPSCYHFPENLKFSKRISSFFNFCKSLGPIELWNFKVISAFQFHFHKLQYVLQNNYWIHKHTFSNECSSKTTFSWLEHRRAAAPAGALSYCFGMQLAVNRQPGSRARTRRAGT